MGGGGARAGASLEDLTYIGMRAHLAQTETSAGKQDGTIFHYQSLQDGER